MEMSVTFWLAWAVVCLLLWMTSRQPRDLPPGPAMCFSLVGHLPYMLREDPRQVFRGMRQRYGDVFHLYLGSKLVVVLNGYDVIREALVKHGDVFSERPSGFVFDTIRERMGVLGSSGPTWLEQRKFTMGALRELGVGKNRLQDKIMEEVHHLTEALREEEGHAFDPKYKIIIAVSNVIGNITFGKRFDYDDPVFVSYISRIRDVLDNVGSTAAVATFPVLRYIPGDPFHCRSTLDNMHFIETDFIQPVLKEHMEKYNPDNPVADFIDAYISEMKKAETEGKPTTMNEKNLIKVIGDLFVAGTDTTANTLRWALLIFLNYPDSQDKVFEEIQSKVGLGRAARLEDKVEMPYVEAFIQEVLRFANIGGLGMPHATSTEVVFRGFRLPPGTDVIPNLDSVLHDPALWDRPEEFRPERFLQDGQVVKKEELIAFSTGRRMCLGESLARMEIFLFLVTLVQHFRFVSEDESAPPKLQGVLGIGHSTIDFKVKAIPRF